MADLTIVVVDDDPDYLALLASAVEEAGARAEALSSAASFLGVDRDVDGVITDYRVPTIADGEAIVRSCHERRVPIPVAVLTGIDRAESAIRLLRLGADDYIVKPPSRTSLHARVRAFVERVALARRVSRLSAGTATGASAVLSASPALKPLLVELPRAAHSGANVLISGESGSGKELAARAVHELSRRAKGPFVGIDCGAIPETLLENELFGHKRGAFSDAREDRAGLVEQAHGGTLFLDEVGEMPLAVQAKLLRFLQTREYRRLGDPNVRVADVRIVAATHKALRQAADAGSFRHDLLYRLDVIRLYIPPLRQRPADVPLLATTFLRRYAREFDTPALSFSEDALSLLSAQRWKGNVRELENVVQRVAALADRVVVEAHDVRPLLDDPGERPSLTPPGADLDVPYHVAKQKVVDAFERQYVVSLLRRYEGRIGTAARAAGIDRKSLARLLSRHNVRGRPSVPPSDPG